VAEERAFTMDEGIFVELTDDNGDNFKLEVIGEVEFEGQVYVVFLPADMDENDPDYGFIILKSVEVDGEEQFDSVDDEELVEKLYALYMAELFDDEEEGTEEA